MWKMKKNNPGMTTSITPTRHFFTDRKITRLGIISCVTAGLLIGCAHIRKLTYPADFVYLEDKQVTGKMLLMSSYMRQIDEILLEDSTVSSAQQERIVNLLSSIDATVDSLGAGNVRTNHLLIDDHIDEFKTEVLVALRDARSDPPNYYALGRLSGGCVACHKYREY